MIEGTLVASSNSGRYALEDSETGRDITSGMVLDIFIGGSWIRGSIEHAAYLYVIDTIGRPAQRGYHFIAQDGGTCGLCTGMNVRLPE